MINKLYKGSTYWITQPFGSCINCDSGTLWLTFDNYFLDVILEAGQSHWCAKNSKLAIYALTDSSFHVS
jgi:hypothetical protein